MRVYCLSSGNAPSFFYNMKRFVLPALLAIAAILACNNESKLAEPSVFKVSPRSANAEDGFAHTLTVKVTCDVAFKYSLEDGSWITIEAGDKDAKNVTALSLQLATNDGDAARSDVLTLKAGTKALTVEISQKTASSALPLSQVSLKYIFPSTVSFTFPEDWTLSCKDSWLEAEPASGKADATARVELRANEFNLTDAARNTELIISLGSAEIALPVTQESSLPSGAFAEKVYGLYNFDGLGGNIVYDAVRHQTNLVKRPEESLFRLVNPGDYKMLEIGGLPATYENSAQAHIVMYQNWSDKLNFRIERDAWVLKIDGAYAWLIDSDLRGYVVKK